MGRASAIRTICYVDGFNLYYGMRSAGLRPYFWLDIHALAARLVRPPFQLIRTKYFTARIAGSHPGDTPERRIEREGSRLRQTTYLEALSNSRFLDVIEGHFLLKRQSCGVCKADFVRAEEKMTDVRIATELLTDAFLDRFDSAMIISGDSDLVPPIDAVRTHFPNKSIVVAFPPDRRSLNLQTVAEAVIQIWPRTIKLCQLPDQVKKADGTLLNRPPEWC